MHEDRKHCVINTLLINRDQNHQTNLVCAIMTQSIVFLADATTRMLKCCLNNNAELPAISKQATFYKTPQKLLIDTKFNIILERRFHNKNLST